MWCILHVFSFVCLCVTALRSMQESKELVISVAAAINSLSFYQVETSGPRNSQLAIAMRKTDRPSCRWKIKSASVGFFYFILYNHFVSFEFLSPTLLTLSLSVMKKLLLSCDMDVMLEATRVFGNLAQSKDVRDFIVQSKGENKKNPNMDTLSHISTWDSTLAGVAVLKSNTSFLLQPDMFQYSLHLYILLCHI